MENHGVRLGSKDVARAAIMMALTQNREDEKVLKVQYLMETQ